MSPVNYTLNISVRQSPFIKLCNMIQTTHEGIKRGKGTRYCRDSFNLYGNVRVCLAIAQSKTSKAFHFATFILHYMETPLIYIFSANFVCDINRERNRDKLGRAT